MTAERRILLAVLLASAILSALFASWVRYGSGLNPDETAHYGYLQLMAAQHGLVKFVPPPGGTLAPNQPEPWETHQPPLYYLLCLPVYLLGGGNVFLIRLVSVAIQVATVGLAFRAGKDLFPGLPGIAPSMAAFVAFLPVQAQLGGAINNDSLTTLICAAVFWRLGLLVRNGQDMRGAVILGALLAAGIWTKLSVFQLFPAVLVAYALAAKEKALDTKRALSLCAAALGLSVLLASPWLIRNTILYGDPLALGIYRLTGRNFTPDEIVHMPAFGWTFGDYVRNVSVRSFATFWYILDPNLPPSQFLGPLPKLAVVLALGLGGLFGVYLRLRNGALDGESGRERMILFLFLSGIALLTPFYAKFVLTVFQAQGRYFLPVLLPVAAVTLIGWGSYSAKRERPPVAAYAVVILVLLAFSILQLLGTFQNAPA